MRRLVLPCVALMSLSMVMATSAWAGVPGAGLLKRGSLAPGGDGAPVGPSHAGQVGHTHAHPPQPGHVHSGDHKCMNPDCQVARAVEANGGAPIVINGPGPIPYQGSPSGIVISGATGVPCSACEASAAGSYHVAPMDSGEMPGHASLGGESPGYARLGDSAPVSGEPTPIGVVRTDYTQHQGGGVGGYSPAGRVDPLAAMHSSGSSSMGAMGPGMPQAGMYPPSNPYQHATTGRQPSFLRTFIGYGGPLSRMREGRTEREASAHAATRLGPGSRQVVTELPASMVYGR